MQNEKGKETSTLSYIMWTRAEALSKGLVLTGDFYEMITAAFFYVKIVKTSHQSEKIQPD